MSEPAVTLTDYALALECAVFFVVAVRWHGHGDLRRWWAAFFATIGLAALIGGTAHGYFPDETIGVGRLLWLGTLLTLGLTSVAAWSIGSHLALGRDAGAFLRGTAVAVLAVYAIVVTFVTRAFLAAIVMYLPATLFLLGALVSRYRRAPGTRLALGIAGLALTFAAAVIQQLRIGVHPVWFDHNALYHAVQAVALLLLFIAARATVMESQPAVRK